METNTHKILSLKEESDRMRADALKRAECAQQEAERHAIQSEAYAKVLELLGATFDDKTKTKEVSTVKRGRSPSGKWTEIYAALHMLFDEPYTYEDIQAAADAAEHDVSDGGLRTQMMNAVKAGIFERVKAGKFKLTDYGLETIDVRPDENSSAAVLEEARAESADDAFGSLNLQTSPPRQ